VIDRPAQPQVAKHIEITGIVQGVGFRPFVYNLAVAHGLCGWVRNTSGCVEIEVQGGADAVESFVQKLTAEAPPLARIESVSVNDMSSDGFEEFVILKSKPQAGAYQLVSPDIATCVDCLRELFDPQDRRYGYPFTNCTNCGPRFTIIQDIPYDRPKTTMHKFPLCSDCRAEYEDPTNRRFHAQPNACPVCGPHIWLVGSGPGRNPTSAVHRSDSRQTDGLQTRAREDGLLDRAQGSEIIRAASRLLKKGQILALKGLGGFHLACDATEATAVQLLRERKHRPHKPFALMMHSMEEIEEHCWVSPAEEALLTSSASPVVLLPWREDSAVVRDVAPNNRYLGVMLPYTPLHHLLLREVGVPLVMTSGNLSEEPIAKDNDEALRRLGPLADAFLLHDRDIYARYDDSVWFVPSPEQPQPIRRARGYAPHPVRVSFPLRRILACGAELKNTFCLTHDQYAFVSQHVGDMENLETLEHFQFTVKLYEDLFRAEPVSIACDLHPDYLATRYATERAAREGLPLFEVQHHHAHIASCLADNDWPPDGGPVIGVAMDGTGYGSDGRIWGGEFLIADYRSSERFGQLQYLPLPGGDAATRKPYRNALAYLHQCLGHVPDLPFLASVPKQEIALVQRMVERGINTPLTSSCGRLFDAISALLGICLEASYEAQAAIELEMVAGDVEHAMAAYPFSIEVDEGRHIVRLEPLLKAIVQSVHQHRTQSDISSAFHSAIAEIIVRMCQIIREQRELHTVALSGGCFQNRQLLRLAAEALRSQGFRVLLHRQVPCNDGGLSLGQAMIAHFTQGGRP
jgi:hydrogenase maturation protein HypF